MLFVMLRMLRQVRSMIVQVVDSDGGYNDGVDTVGGNNYTLLLLLT